MPDDIRLPVRKICLGVCVNAQNQPYYQRYHKKQDGGHEDQEQDMLAVSVADSQSQEMANRSSKRKVDRQSDSMYERGISSICGSPSPVFFFSLVWIPIGAHLAHRPNDAKLRYTDRQKGTPCQEIHQSKSLMWSVEIFPPEGTSLEFPVATPST